MALPVRREQSRPAWDPFREFQDLYERMGAAVAVGGSRWRRSGR